MATTQKVVTHLWFDDDAEAAAKFYTSLLPNSKIESVTYFDRAKNLYGVVFTLSGQEYRALNAGPTYKLSPAVSLWVKCDDQKELDRIWNAILENGGKEQACGWVQDKWGLSWQVHPAVLDAMISDPDEEKRNRVLQAVWGMIKIDLATLEKAYRGVAA
ncbi:VOC family protein [Dongia rigui]|uniref:VOC family protein n=1 Tax=Dongia rigui TaxID=940149 RepID=A0ABU5DW12_9PROT|nr:VOC family protein [Dongia rigui]MDY0871495.1 VOC family protein [Dongia rigui]